MFFFVTMSSRVEFVLEFVKVVLIGLVWGGVVFVLLVVVVGKMFLDI